MSFIGGAFGRTMLLLALTLVFVVAISIPVGCISAASARLGARLPAAHRHLRRLGRAGIHRRGSCCRRVSAGPREGGGLGWFPSVGWAGECPNGQGIDPHNFQCPAAGHGLTHVGQVIYHLTLPAFALALVFIGVQSRYLRNSLIDALDAPYITVARGKGLPERAVLFRHALRNAFVAFVPALVSDLGLLFGAALAVDYIFQLGGLGTVLIALLELESTASPRSTSMPCSSRCCSAPPSSSRPPS